MGKYFIIRTGEEWPQVIPLGIADGIPILDGGVPIGDAQLLNFLGAGVTVAVDGLNPEQINVTIPGGGGGAETLQQAYDQDPGVLGLVPILVDPVRGPLYIQGIPAFVNEIFGVSDDTLTHTYLSLGNNQSQYFGSHAALLDPGFIFEIVGPALTYARFTSVFTGPVFDVLGSGSQGNPTISGPAGILSIGVTAGSPGVELMTFIQSGGSGRIFSRVNFEPFTVAQTLGIAGSRWGNIFSVHGNYSGVVTTNEIDSTAPLLFSSGSSTDSGFKFIAASIPPFFPVVQIDVPSSNHPGIFINAAAADGFTGITYTFIPLASWSLGDGGHNAVIKTTNVNQQFIVDNSLYADGWCFYFNVNASQAATDIAFLLQQSAGMTGDAFRLKANGGADLWGVDSTGKIRWYNPANITLTVGAAGAAAAPPATPESYGSVVDDAGNLRKVALYLP